MMDIKKPFVLVVEDDIDTRLLMNHYLRDDYELDFTASVTESKKS